MATHFYNVAMQMMGDSDLDLADGATDVRVLLLTTDDDGSPTEQRSRGTLADIMGSAAEEATAVANYGRVALANKRLTTDEGNDRVNWQANDVTFDDLGTNETIRAAVVYLHVDGTNANDIPICRHDGGFPEDCNGEDFHVRWNGSTDGTDGIIGRFRHPS